MQGEGGEGGGTCTPALAECTPALAARPPALAVFMHTHLCYLYTCPGYLVIIIC